MSTQALSLKTTPRQHRRAAPSAVIWFSLLLVWTCSSLSATTTASGLHNAAIPKRHRHKHHPRRKLPQPQPPQEEAPQRPRWIPLPMSSTAADPSDGDEGRDELEGLSSMKSDPNARYNVVDVQNNSNPRLVALTLSLTYFCVMGAKCALPSVLPMLVQQSEQGLSYSLGANPELCMANLLLVSTLAVAVGKLLLGPLIDYWGGSASLKLTLAVLTGLFLYLSTNQTFAGFFVAWIGVDFIFSSCWAASINAIHEHFPPNQWGTLIGNLATGARAGNALSFLLFAQVLQWSDGLVQPWRPIFTLSGLAQLIPLGMLFLFCRPNQHNTTPAVEEQSNPLPETESKRTPSLSTTWKIALREAATVDFWLHFVSRSVLMVFASFLLFVPTLMCQIYQTSSSFASQTGSVYALGCLLAVTFGSNTFSKLGKTPRLWALVGLLGSAAAASAAQLAFVSDKIVLSPAAACATFFVWGYSMAIPFYIPPSLYALKRGGTECSATIADLFDIGGFGLLASFNGYVASLASSTAASDWIPTFQMTTLCALISLVALLLATWKEATDDSTAILLER